MKIKICPRCGSIDIIGDPTTDSMGIAQPSFMCNYCKYSGMLFPEVDEKDVSKFRKEIKNLRKT